MEKILSPQKILLFLVQAAHRFIMSVYIIHGPMFSGKTTEMIRTLERFKVAGRNTLLIKHSKDKRHGTETSLSSHGNVCWKPTDKNHKVIMTDDLKQFLPGSKKEHLFKDVDVIAVDEFQFFDKSILEFVKHYSRTKLKHLILTGLNGNAFQKSFNPHMGDLYALATKSRQQSCGWDHSPSRCCCAKQPVFFCGYYDV